MNSRLRALRALHPFPSFVNAGLVLALATVAGATFGVAALLAGGMLALQLCIGIVNDLADVRLDAQTKPWKPIPAGAVSVGSAQAAAAVLGVAALALAMTQGPIVAALAAVMLACGLVYDLWLKPTVFAWVCFSIAFAILPVYAWYGAVREVPPLSAFLIPLAALAGPALQLSNGIVDLERDEAGGIRTLATRLGRRRALAAAVALLVVIYSLAWATLTLMAGSVNLAVAVATVLALAGVALQSRDKVGLREAGWSLQALGVALLGLGWLSAVA